MHPVQEHINTLGIDYLIQRLTKYIYIYMNMKGTVFQPRVLQLNLDNINRLLQNKYLDRKNQGICQRGNRTHNLLRARQMPKPLDHQLLRIYHSETDVLMDNVGQSWGTLQTPQYT